VLDLAEPKTFRSFLRTQGRRQSDPELTAVARWPRDRLGLLMHQLIVADVRLAPKHRASRAWLRRHGFDMGTTRRSYGSPNLRWVDQHSG
jgi:hypothetical protein